MSAKDEGGRMKDEVKGGLAPGEYVATVRRDGVMIIGDFELHDLQPGDLEQLGVPVMEIARGTCVVCGCTDDDCSQCIKRTGEPCSWVNKEHTLCSACVGQVEDLRIGGVESRHAVAGCSETPEQTEGIARAKKPLVTTNAPKEPRKVPEQSPNGDRGRDEDRTAGCVEDRRRSARPGAKRFTGGLRVARGGA